MRIELTSINLGGEITLVGSPRSKLRLCNVESPRYVCMYIHGYQEWSNVVCVGIKSRDCCVATSVPVSDNYPRFRTSLYFIAGTGRYFPRFIDSGYNNFSSIDRFLLRFLDFFPIPLSSSVGQERERELLEEHVSRALGSLPASIELSPNNGQIFAYLIMQGKRE